LFVPTSPPRSQLQIIVPLIFFSKSEQTRDPKFEQRFLPSMLFINPPSLNYCGQPAKWKQDKEAKREKSNFGSSETSAVKTGQRKRPDTSERRVQ
jgi:hypothetical protein